MSFVNLAAYSQLGHLGGCKGHLALEEESCLVIIKRYPFKDFRRVGIDLTQDINILTVKTLKHLDGHLSKDPLNEVYTKS